MNLKDEASLQKIQSKTTFYEWQKIFKKSIFKAGHPKPVLWDNPQG